MKIILRNFLVICASFCGSVTNAQDTIIAAPINVESRELKDVKLWGIYEELETGALLASNAWRNARADNLEILFSKLNKDLKFSPLLNLSRRAVFSGGIAPIDDYEALAIMRFSLAQRIGAIDNAANFVANIPNLNAYENLAIRHADASLFLGKIEEACQIVEGLRPKNPNRKLLELRAACFALHNEGAAANLSLEIANSLTGQKNDEWLLRAVNYVGAMNGDNVPAFAPNINFNGENGVNYVLSTRAKLPIKGELPFDALRILVKGDVNLSPENAIGAVRFGLVNLSQLQKFAPSTKPIVANAAEVPNAQPMQDGQSDTITEIMFYLTKARDLNEFANISKIIAPLLQGVKIFSIDDAKYLSAAAIFAKDKESYLRFSNFEFNQKAAYGLAAFLQFEMVENFPINRRIDAVAKNSSQHVLAIQDGIIASSYLENDEKIGGLLNVNLVQNSNIPHASLYALDDAVARKSIAEVVLISHYILQGQNPKNADVFAINKIIKALKFIGLRNEAKELAVFALMARNTDFIAPLPILKAIAPKPTSSTTIEKPAKPPASTKPKQQTRPDWGAQVD